MKNICVIFAFLLLTGCQWIMTHPEEDAEVVLFVEKAAENLYRYETKTLSPTPPQSHVKNGPTGPKGSN